MLFIREHLDGIADGSIKLAFRKWQRPTVKTGGRLRIPGGVLSIKSVEQINPQQITERDAKKAGYPSSASLLKELEKREGDLYRIRFELAGEDERIELRKVTKFSVDEWNTLLNKLDRLDKFSSQGDWVVTFLRMVSEKPGIRAPDLAAEFGVETLWFKTNMRKLKELGLTESLVVGYRLSPRGKVVLRKLTK